MVTSKTTNVLISEESGIGLFPGSVRNSIEVEFQFEERDRDRETERERGRSKPPGGYERRLHPNNKPQQTNKNDTRVTGLSFSRILRRTKTLQANKLIETYRDTDNEVVTEVTLLSETVKVFGKFKDPKAKAPNKAA